MGGGFALKKSIIFPYIEAQLNLIKLLHVDYPLVAKFSNFFNGNGKPKEQLLV